MSSILSFESLNLHEKLMNSVSAQNFKAPTEIQKAVIPIILKGRDVMASADTGAGKTLAFVIPALQRLLEPSSLKGKGPRVLVLTPTRELADQVTEVTRKMAKSSSLKIGTITGGVAYYAQENLLRQPLDFLVATPGRLIDHMNRGRVDFSRLELFILDEADRMLDMGFMKDIEKIFSPMPKNRQILLFSATLEGEVQQIAGRFLNNPERVQLTTAKKENLLISQLVHQVDNFKHKLLILDHILTEGGLWQAIIFIATKRGARDLASELAAKKISCAELHGDMKQSKRTQTIERMRRGQIRVLVATDVAARGLDVKSLSHVINFDLPKSGEDYIHRIGRTGRAGEKGTAISLVGPKDWNLLSEIERFIGKRLERFTIPGLEPKLSVVKDHRDSRNNARRQGHGGQGRQGGHGRRQGQGRASQGGYSQRRMGQGEGRPEFRKRSEGRTDQRKEFKFGFKPEFKSHSKPNTGAGFKANSKPRKIVKNKNRSNDSRTTRTEQGSRSFKSSRASRIKETEF